MPRTTLHISDNCKQSKTSSVFGVFLPRVFLFFSNEPEPCPVGKSIQFGLPFQLIYRLQIFLSTFDFAQGLYEDLDEDQEMITPYQLGLLMVDWTNPQKAAEM